MDTRAKDQWKRGILVTLLLLVIAALIFVTLLRKMTSTATKSQTLELKQAIETYYTEYRTFPAANADAPSPQDRSTESNFELMNALMPTEDYTPGMSPRKIAFYGGIPATRKSNGQYHSGIRTHPDGSKELLDPWGNHYRVIMDTNHDDQVTAPAWAGQSEPLQQSVIVWSPGPDGKDETARDNITSW